jgi:hypothetical protein
MYRYLPVEKSKTKDTTAQWKEEKDSWMTIEINFYEENHDDNN